MKKSDAKKNGRYEGWALWHSRRMGEWGDFFLWITLAVIINLAYFYPRREDFCFVGRLAAELPEYRVRYLSFGTWDMCRWAEFWPALAVSWFLFMPLLVLCFAFWASSPGLRAAGVTVKRADGGRLGFAGAACYVLMRYLPTHIFCLYIFWHVLHLSLDFNRATSGVILTAAAQIFWTLPFFLPKLRGHIADLLARTRAELSPQKREKLERIRKSRLGRVLRPVRVMIETGSFLAIFLFFSVLSVQILRAPATDPEFNAALYQNQTALWEDNAYFLLAGLASPPDAGDAYAHGRYQTWLGAVFYQRLRDHIGIGTEYDVPPAVERPHDYAVPTRANRLELYGDTSGLYCFNRFFRMGEAERQICIRNADLHGMIWDNYILWGRFEKLPEYRNFSVPPELTGARFPRNTAQRLARMKAAHLVYIAAQGQTENAVEEWIRYMLLYRNMLESRGSVQDKSSYMIMAQIHFTAFEEIVYYAPEAVVARYDDIAELLLLDRDRPPLHADRLLADDWALTEPLLLSTPGANGTVRNKMYECLKPGLVLGRTPADILPERYRACSLRELTTRELIERAVLDPGNLFINSLHYLLYNGVLRGEEMILGIHTLAARWRMAVLGVAMLKDGVTPENASEYIAAAPEELKNPFTLKPFDWNEQTRSLYFSHFSGDIDIHFHLPMR